MFRGSKHARDRRRVALRRALLVCLATLCLAALAWAQTTGVWEAADAWARRVLLGVAVIGIITGAAITWAKLDDRVADNAEAIERHERRFAALEDTVSRKLDEVLALLRDGHGGR